MHYAGSYALYIYLITVVCNMLELYELVQDLREF